MVASWEIDEAVNEIALWPIKCFYPTLIAKRTGVPLDVVFQRLIELTKDNKLYLKWEVRCPGDCARTLMVLDEKTVNIKDTVCNYCGLSFCDDSVDKISDCIFPAFEINSEYKKHLQKSQEGKKKQLTPEYAH